MAVDQDRVVGTAGTIDLELTVPGPAIVPMAGVTYVGVLPTHRRQGILTALVAALHEDARRPQESPSPHLPSVKHISSRSTSRTDTRRAAPPT